MLTTDFSGLMSPPVARDHGVAHEELLRLQAASPGYSATIKKQWQTGQVTFPGLPDDIDSLQRVTTFAQRHLGAIDNVLLLGVGGSSLGAQAIDDALRPVERTPRRPGLRVIDNTDPATVLRALNGLEPRRTLTLVVSKSGNTLETVAALALAETWYRDSGCALNRHIVVVTGPAGGFLNKYASLHGLERFIVPQGVGGRFSVLSPCGLLPAALLGYDIEAMLAGAREARNHSLDAPPDSNGPLLLGGMTALLAHRRSKSVSVMMPYASRLTQFSRWYAQLWAESLGKARNIEGKPVNSGQSVVTASGATDQHSQLQLFLEGPNDKVITFIEVDEHETHLPLPDTFDYAAAGLANLKGKTFSDLIHAEREGTQQALCEQDRPTALVMLPHLDERSLGALFMFFELATAYAALYLNVNAYDQPAVELGKKITNKLLGG